MGISKIVKHQAYELHCSAKALDSGKFAPILVVARQAWPSRPRTIATRGDAYANEDSAVDAAHAQGMEWVDHYG